MLLEIYKFLISNRIFIITVLKRTPPQMFFAPLHNSYGKMPNDSLQGYFRASIFHWFPLRSKQLWGNQACFCHQGPYKNFHMLIQLSKPNNKCPMSHAKNDWIFNSRYNLFEQKFIFPRWNNWISTSNQDATNKWLFHSTHQRERDHYSLGGLE